MNRWDLLAPVVRVEISAAFCTFCPITCGAITAGNSLSILAVLLYDRLPLLLSAAMDIYAGVWESAAGAIPMVEPAQLLLIVFPSPMVS